MKTLVTGSSSGLGRYLLEEFNAIAYARTIEEECQKFNQYGGIENIIHCAFNMNKNVQLQDFASYIQDTLFLSNKITRIPHKLFIFISSIDVYNFDSNVLHYEDESIPIEEVTGCYAMMKLAVEGLVRKNCDNYIIIRPGMLLGPYMRENNIKRTLGLSNKPLTLSGDSSFNFTSYADIKKVIMYSIKNKIRGTFNVVSSNEVSLCDLANKYNPSVEFGKYTYITPHVSNEKIINIIPNVLRGSMDCVESYINNDKN